MNHPPGAEAGLDFTDWNTRIVLLTIGIGALGTKLAEVVLNAIAKYRAIDSESVQGKLRHCLEEAERARLSSREEAVSERASHAASADRINAHHAAVCRDYEARLDHLHEEITYLHGEISSLRESDTQKMTMIENLNITLVQQTQSMGVVAQRAAELAQTSAQNTSAAIRRIPRAVQGHDTDVDMATITTPADRVQVVLPQHEEQPQ